MPSSTDTISQHKKKGGGFLKRQAAKSTKSDMTEEQLLRKKSIIVPEDVSHLNRATENYLIDGRNNEFKINFTRFKIRDIETGEVLFEISKPDDESDDGLDYDESDDDSGRFVRYRFSEDFLKLKSVGATIEFTVGPKPLENFRMIERHFFRDRLLKSFDFTFGFCMPNSKNTCEHIYEFPSLTQSEIDEIVSSPYETRSDSFYFVNNRLVMHNKADYAYDG
ncbi:protein unc-119 homolog B [Hydra vulgaris]|nr:protein unc-119 homolog B [Hydra vulgaris]XP_012556298.1 protein unc-119 homolog B [Hydra vulgaris]XP_012556299.1 protein unc-119 homolog B [Hydra vulgaris]